MGLESIDAANAFLHLHRRNLSGYPEQTNRIRKIVNPGQACCERSARAIVGFGCPELPCFARKAALRRGPPVREQLRCHCLELMKDPMLFAKLFSDSDLGRPAGRLTGQDAVLPTFFPLDRKVNSAEYLGAEKGRTFRDLLGFCTAIWRCCRGAAEIVWRAFDLNASKPRISPTQPVSRPREASSTVRQNDQRNDPEVSSQGHRNVSMTVRMDLGDFGRLIAILGTGCYVVVFP